METLKYKFADYKKLVDAFSTVMENHEDNESVLKEIEKIAEYPNHVVKAFLDTITSFSDKDKDYLNTYREAIAALAILKMNFAKPIESDF